MWQKFKETGIPHSMAVTAVDAFVGAGYVGLFGIVPAALLLVLIALIPGAADLVRPIFAGENSGILWALAFLSTFIGVAVRSADDYQHLDL